MTIIDEKIIDIGIALGLDGAKAIAQERERVRDYEKTVLDILGHHSVEFEGAGLDEEIDLEGFINFLAQCKILCDDSTSWAPPRPALAGNRKADVVAFCNTRVIRVTPSRAFAA